MAFQLVAGRELFLPGGEVKGRILTRDGEWHDVPAPFLEQGVVSWPLLMDDMASGVPPRYEDVADMYHRHEISEGEEFIYLLDSSLERGEVPQHIIDALLGRCGRESTTGGADERP